MINTNSIPTKCVYVLLQKNKTTTSIQNFYWTYIFFDREIGGWLLSMWRPVPVIQSARFSSVFFLSMFFSLKLWNYSTELFPYCKNFCIASVWLEMRKREHLLCSQHFLSIDILIWKTVFENYCRKNFSFFHPFFFIAI